jgi:hypothetical protein
MLSGGWATREISLSTRTRLLIGSSLSTTPKLSVLILPETVSWRCLDTGVPTQAERHARNRRPVLVRRQSFKSSRRPGRQVAGGPIVHRIRGGVAILECFPIPRSELVPNDPPPESLSKRDVVILVILFKGRKGLRRLAVAIAFGTNLFSLRNGAAMLRLPP